MTAVICAHGVGVDPTSRGLLTEICAGFDPELLNLAGEHEGGRCALPLTDQTQIVAAACRAAGDDVVLIGHSMGALAALHADVDVRALILLSMPWTSMRGTLLRRWPHLQQDAFSCVTRSTGERSWFSPAFWADDLLDADPMNALGARPEALAVWAGDDQVLGRVPRRIGGLRVPGSDHDFNPCGRPAVGALISAICK